MPPYPFPSSDDEDSEGIGNYISSEGSESSEDDEEYGDDMFDENSEEENEKMEMIDLKRTESKTMSKNYRYEIIDMRKLNSLFCTKLIALKSNFDYANLHDTIYIKIFEENQFISAKTLKILNDKIFDYMEKYATKTLKIKDNEDLMCNICCCELTTATEARHFGCGHVFCTYCMTDYLEYKISSGPESLSTPCPFDGCPFKITSELVEICCKEESQKKYQKYLLDHFVDLSPYLAFCSSPDCEMIFLADENILSYKGHLAQMNASCDCGTVVCMRCKGLGHEPLSCEMYEEWEESIDVIYDKLNYKWKKDNTKKCPGCKCSIEKNQGCNFMQCSKCKQQFCWFCLKDWKFHDQKHVWKNECNKFENKKSVEEMNEEEKLKRMEFYMDRFRGHKLSYELNDDRIKDHIKEINQEGSDFLKLNTEVIFFLNFFSKNFFK